MPPPCAPQNPLLATNACQPKEMTKTPFSQESAPQNCHQCGAIKQSEAASRRKSLWSSEFSDSSQVKRFLKLQNLSRRESSISVRNENYFACATAPRFAYLANTPGFLAKGSRGIYWKGTLFKRSGAIISSWQPRDFKLGQKIVVDIEKHSQITYPALSYTSKSKGERTLVVKDIRREPQLDSDLKIAFSVGLIHSPSDESIHLNPTVEPSTRQRVTLMTTSDLEAVALLTCLRRILEPGRALPTLRDAMHFPAYALRMLE
jgi:hypothetical protein